MHIQPFYILVLFSAIVAIGITSKLHKVKFPFSSKVSNYLFNFFLFFILVGYPYVVLPNWIEKMYDQLTLTAYDVEVIVSPSHKEESYIEVLSLKSATLSKEVIKKLPPSFLADYSVGDHLSIVYNYDTNTFLEASRSAKIFSASIIFSGLFAIFIAILCILYAIGALSNGMIIRLIKFFVQYVAFPIIFIGILSATALYLYNCFINNSWADNPVLVVVSVFFLLLFLVVSYSYTKVFMTTFKSDKTHTKLLESLPIRDYKKLVEHPFNKVAWDSNHIKIALQSLYNAKLPILSIVPEIYIKEIDANILLLDQAFFAIDQSKEQSNLRYRNQNHKKAMDVVREITKSNLVDLVRASDSYEIDYEKNDPNFEKTVLSSLLYSVDFDVLKK